MKILEKKLYWSICVGAIIFGGILLGIGVSLGGATSFSIGSNGLQFYSMFSNHPIGNFDLQFATIEEKVTAIQLESGLGDVIFTSGDTLTISYYGDVSYKINNNTLEVESSWNKLNSFGIRMTNSDVGFIEITVPQYVNSIEIDSSGRITLSDLNLSEIDIEASLGDILMEKITASQVELNANLGNVTLNSCVFDDISAELNMGAFTSKNLDILTSGTLVNRMGAMEIDLVQEESAYLFTTNMEMGVLSINGGNRITSNGDISIFVETSMGSVNITTN
ncbi:MAG: DUF4097 family beta strand repeat-containing protein [Eubacteriales bacterium]